MKGSHLLLFFLLLFIRINAQQVTLMRLATIDSPTDIKHANDKRLFVTDRHGTIWIIDSSGSLLSQPFLNISDHVITTSLEQGLVGLAFDPDYHNNGFFYVDYTRLPDGMTVISRFKVTGNSNHCDSTTEKTILMIWQPYVNHNGGAMQFGSDHYLYIGMGDGGSAGDPENRAQNTDSLLGKILRIDVSDSTMDYKIPPDNPLVGKGGRGEIWDWGLRNPWRFSFDRLTNEFWIADVGQNKYEEVDLEPAGTGGFNYGWRCYEGDSAYNTAGCGPSSDYTFPVFFYDHSLGCSITGGYRYRGSRYPAFYGKYFYGDYCAGKVSYLSETDPGIYTSTITSASLQDITTFGEDSSGELYVGSIKDHGVFKICDSSCVTATDEIKPGILINICPNPNRGIFTISLPRENIHQASIAVKDVWGRPLYRVTKTISDERKILIQLPGLASGAYLLYIQGDINTVKKLIIE